MTGCKCKDKTDYWLIFFIVLFFGNCSGHVGDGVTLKPDQVVKCQK